MLPRPIYGWRGAAFLDQSPAENYNWLSASLFTGECWMAGQARGCCTNGNFAAPKKYPVIFYFYERDADNLYIISSRHHPGLRNIRLVRQQGYLVFDPNIYYKNGEPGASATNSGDIRGKVLGRFRGWILPGWTGRVIAGADTRWPGS